MYRQLTKNTILLLFRTVLTIALSLYITRLALDLLGVESYGLYSVVSSVTSLMSFFSSSLSSSSQRCISYYLGRGENDKVKTVLSSSVNIHILFAIFVIIVAIFFGYVYIEKYLNVSVERINDAKFILCCSIVSVFMVIIGSPFIASILSHERIKVYTWILILEVIVRFAIIFLLHILGLDSVRLYAVAMAFTLSIPSVLAVIYCIVSLKYKYTLRTSNYKEIISLTTWNSFGALSYVLMTQGGTILINSFYGLTLNASRAASLQVQSALLQVSNSAQSAVNPKLVKLYSSCNIPEFHHLLLRSTKYIYFLILIVSVPIFTNSKDLINIWLKNTPDLTNEFVRYIILINLVNSISFGVMAGIQATGKIMAYQLIIGGMLLLNLPMTYIFMLYGYSPLILVKVNLMLAIVALLSRFPFISRQLKLSLKLFIIEVIVPISLASFFSLFISSIFIIKGDGFVYLITNLFISSVVTILSILLFALKSDERNFLKNNTLIFIKRYGINERN